MLDEVLGDIYGMKKKDGESGEQFRERLHRRVSSPRGCTAHDIANAIYDADRDVVAVGQRTKRKPIVFTWTQRLWQRFAAFMFFFTRSGHWLWHKDAPRRAHYTEEFAIFARRGTEPDEKIIREVIDESRPAGAVVEFVMYQEVGGGHR